jgi:hypothetical protein
MKDSVLTRRTTIQYGAALSAAALAAASNWQDAENSDSTAQSDLLAGHIVRIHNARQLTLRPVGEATSLRIKLAANASVQRGISGSVNNFKSFVIAEEIVVAGHRSGSALTASQIGSVYRRVLGTVRQDHISYLTTSTGTLYLSSNIRADAKTIVPKEGTRFSAEIWTDPATGRHEIAVIRPLR